MNQDKIKQAFELWWKEFVKKDLGLNVAAIPDHKIEKAWLAACEWFMSQGEKDFKTWFRGARLEDRIEFSWKDWAEFAWQAAKLSCAKELNERDSRIATLEDELFRQYELVSKIGMELNTRKQAELASKKEG